MARNPYAGSTTRKPPATPCRRHGSSSWTTCTASDRPKPSPAWLATATRRNAHAIHKARRRVELVEPHGLADEPDSVASLDSGLITSELHRCLWDNLQKLPPNCQALLRILAFTGHISHRTVRNILDMPKGSIGPHPRQMPEQIESSPATRPKVGHRMNNDRHMADDYLSEASGLAVGLAEVGVAVTGDSKGHAMASRSSWIN